MMTMMEMMMITIVMMMMILMMMILIIIIMMMIMPVSLDGKHHHHNYHHHHYHYYYTGKVDLYVGKEVVRRAIPNEQACDELVSLIKEYGRWIDPRPVDEASPSSSSSKEETQVNA